MFILRARMLCLFYRQLSDLLSSGVSLAEALNVVSINARNMELRVVAERIKQDLDSGQDLSDSFAKFPQIFPVWHTKVIKYSEESGRLSDGFGLLADYQEKVYASYQAIIVGLAYPVFLLHLAIFLLPLVNAFGCGGSYIFGVFKLLFGVYGPVLVLYFTYRILKGPQLKLGFDNLVLSIPGVNNIIRQISVTGFIRALQYLCASGVGIITAWKMATDAVDNEMIKAQISQGVSVLEQGGTLSEAVVHTKLFSQDVVSMIATAQKTGSIVQSLNMIAHYSEKQTDTVISVLVRVLPVIFYLLVAAFIGMRVVGFYSSYFTRMLSVQ